MNETENELQSGSRVAELEEKCAELRRVVNLLFAGLVLTSFTVTAYIGVQAKRVAQEAAETQRQADETRKLVQQDDANIRAFFAKLADFSRAHPDFQSRVMAKYKITTNDSDAGAKK